MARIPIFIQMLKATFQQWLADKTPRLGAALAFYSILSIGPLLLISIAVVGAFYGEEAARGHITRQIQEMVGRDGAGAIQQMLASSRKTNSNIWAALIGMGTLLLSASGVFAELQDALNTIWQVKAEKTSGVVHFIKGKVLIFMMVLGIGFLLMLSLLITAFVAGLKSFVGGDAPTFAPFFLLMDSCVTLAIISSLFALIFKILPDIDIKWRDVLPAAVFTGILFTIGKFFIGLYLSHSAISSTYGAAGSLVVLLIWIYYSSQILYFGAEFSKVYAQTSGSLSKAPIVFA